MKIIDVVKKFQDKGHEPDVVDLLDDMVHCRKCGRWYSLEDDVINCDDVVSFFYGLYQLGFAYDHEEDKMTITCDDYFENWDREKLDDFYSWLKRTVYEEKEA